MKLITITLLSASYQNAQGFSPLAHGGALKTFPPTLTMPSEHRNRKAQPSSIMNSPTRLHYGDDPPHSRGGDNQSQSSESQSAQQKLKTGFWNALEHTETWMSNILKNSTKENPIARNEVSYECEMNEGTLACIAGIFRRYKEAREMGTRYERLQKQMAYENRYYDVEPMRRTQVVILPFCDFFDQFASCDRITRAITNARVIAQHLITDLAVENLEKESAGFKRDQDWDINVSGATLHPDYTTPQELVDQMKNSGDDNDNNKDKEKLIQEQKNRARQSPYPTLIIEVKASPQPAVKDTRFEGEDTMVDIIFKLEAIYAKSAALHKKFETNTEDIFYHAIGMLNGIEEILPSNMIEVVENWVVENDRRYDADLSTFASANLKHADSAYEFVFANLALHKFIPDDDDDDDGGGGEENKTYTAGLRSYLIMPKFVSTSATSFEKFAGGVNEIVRSIDGLKNRIIVSMMHPEHVDADKRSPAPILVLQWYEQK